MTDRRAPARDMDTSPFTGILADLVSRTPGAFGVVLVDEEGECVDYAGALDPFDLKVVGAHFAIVLHETRTSLPSWAVRTLLVHGAKRSFLVHALPDRYALIVILRPRAAFLVAGRAIARCVHALAAEASWTLPDAPVWHPIYVECTKRRPSGVAPETRSAHTSPRAPSAPRLLKVEVLGTLVLGDGREKGFRVRLESGVELTIVREAGGFWYADEPVPMVRAHDPPASSP